MNAIAKTVNPGTGSVAPLKNVAECFAVAQKLIDRPAGVDGLGLFYGPSGYGKSQASLYVQNKLKAIYIEVFEYWNKQKFTKAILQELGVANPTGSFVSMMDQILSLLQDHPNRLLIIDEADKLIDKQMIEYVRDIYKGARVPVLLVGEELLWDKLKKYERCDTRVTADGMANPSDLDDARALASIYVRPLHVHDDLLQHVLDETEGVTARVVTSLQEIGQFAKARQMAAISRAEYTGSIFTGRVTRRRK